MKKLFLVLASVVLSLIMLFTGCSLTGKDGIDGRDGKDGQNVTIEDIYNKYVSEHGEISFEDFLKEYLNYSDKELEDAISLRASINRSLMSGVTVLVRFSYTGNQSSIFGKQTGYKVYSGSGAILWLDKEAGDAYVVTNCHVVYDDSSDSTYSIDIRLYLYGQDVNGVNYVIKRPTLSTYEITGDENYRIPAEIVGASVSYDIALLKVTGSSVLKRSDAVAVSNKEDVVEALNDSFVQDYSSTVGETVYAIGNPSNEGTSASTGIISKDSEYIDVSLSESNSMSTTRYRVLRTTAPINHGNSGGALYNTSGKIVAIVNAKDDAEDVDNMGYALPANNVRRLLVSMYENRNKTIASSNGKPYGISKAFLNITTTVSDSYARLNEEGIAVIYETVRVNSIEGLPAENILQVNDVLVSAKLTSSEGNEKEDLKITRNYALSEMLISVREGDTLCLTVERDKAEIQLTIEFTGGFFKYFE